MKLHELGLEIQVASRPAAEWLVRDEPGRWCAISIRGPREARAYLRDAKAVVECLFDDVLRNDPQRGFIVPSEVHARRILKAAVNFAPAPLLIHCAMGLRRSPAAALGILYFEAKRIGVADPVSAALEWLGQLGDFYPNARLARLMIEAVDQGEPRPFERFRRHKLWRQDDSANFYDRFLPKRRSL